MERDISVGDFNKTEFPSLLDCLGAGSASSSSNKVPNGST